MSMTLTDSEERSNTDGDGEDDDDDGGDDGREDGEYDSRVLPVATLMLVRKRY